MTRKIRTTTAGFTVAAVALMGLGSTVAFAEDAAPTPAPLSGITGTQGSIQVTKLTPATGQTTTPDGTALKSTPEGAEPIEGVTFTAYRIGDDQTLDLRTNAGWQAAQAIQKTKLTTKDGQVPTEIGGFKVTKVGDGVTTDATGNANLSALPVGLYLVVESINQDEVTIHPTTGKEKKVKASMIRKAEPFVISVPMTNPGNQSEWMYDIHVYPKNTPITSPVKTLNDDAKGKGAGNDAAQSEILYTLSAEIPATSLNQFMLIDRFLDEQLEWVGKTTDTVRIGKQELESGDFTVTISDKPVGKYRYVTMELTKSGLEKLKYSAKENPEKVGQMKVDQKVFWDFHTRVKATTAGERIPNKVFEITNPDNEGFNQWNPKEPNNPRPNLPKNPEKPKPHVPTTPDSPEPGGSTPGNEVESYYGKVLINKKGSDGTKLNGAKFQLFQCDPSDGYKLGEQISVNGKSEWISGTDAEGEEDKVGKIVISGLLVNDYRNGGLTFEKDEKPVAWKSVTAYCLKEVQAPAGYELLPQPINFQVLKENASATGQVTLDVTDVKKNANFPMPATGGAGIATLVVAGSLLLLGSGAYALAAVRKRKQD
ncbi:hypothetical protein BSR29_00010 [Boudabousia liubingyangii]|uniref:Gram-positive pilin subunit D1 N-terminal domain-containing protein n=1 Tax=Boudabousia liubingyangii TaxID=1921764 RepID=A0A1Q5PP76_9ACTO|nr:SpaH/EbpB family LPXTG-anchored major pilin [Boudabousia liubingyangii]OKL49398.1 hypothetical protein BSR29_00010 [Boudabousia liubingyangii]